MMQKIIATFCGLSLLGALLFVPPLPSKADPVTVVVTVLLGGAVLGGATIYDYNSCDINLFWGCGAGGAGSDSTSEGGHGTGSQPPAPPPGEQQGVPSPEGAGQGAPQACSSTPNACGMVSTGFVQGGQCSATPPPASSCPAPAIGQGDFYAQPTLVRSGNSTTLNWSVSSATTCALNGGGLSLSGLSISGQNDSNAITQQTIFTLMCQNGVGGPSSSAQTTVNVVPTYEEI